MTHEVDLVGNYTSRETGPDCGHQLTRTETRNREDEAR